MPYFILASVLAYPFLEIMSLIWLADQIGGLATLLVVLASFAAGVLMLRHQRLGVAMTLMNDLRSGQIGWHSLLSVARYYIAAVLLIIPGLLGDVIAIALLLPWGRQGVPFQARPTAAREEGVIDGEYRRVDPQADPHQRRIGE
ncbi:FxsA family protein [Chitinibacter tainanensis]|uniref:FxsA family protein n=1 Tax=Chitinibacter tainanensis TaxID=230667 RepID=UPI0004020651|nr:FxsA family protein [Chitinibacter tainanensis]